MQAHTAIARRILRVSSAPLSRADLYAGPKSGKTRQKRNSTTVACGRLAGGREVIGSDQSGENSDHLRELGRETSI